MLEIKAQDEQIDKLLKCKPLPENEVKSLCAKAKEILVKENFSKHSEAMKFLKEKHMQINNRKKCRCPS